MAQHTAVLLQKPASQDPTAGIEVKQVDRPVPGEGQVLVRIILRPVDPADLFCLQGVYPGFKPKEYPAVPGLEGLGVVEESGPGVKELKKGQRVVGAPWPAESGNGTWQQYGVVPQERLLPVPDGVTDDTAAQFFVNPVAIYGMLNVLQIPKGEYLLLTAAGSVLGRMAIQLTKHYGIKTIGVVRSDRHVQELKEMGEDEVIVSSKEDVVARVKEITGGKGAYGGIDCVGGETFGQVASSLRDGGTALVYGAMSGMEASFSIPDLLFRGVKLHGFWIASWMAGMDQKQQRQALTDIMTLLEKQVIAPYTGEKIPLERVKEAVEKAQAPGRGGKVLLEG